MKKDGKYRYSLQFGMSSEEEIRAGELLESLGNKKSKVLIAALNEYVTNHPELESERCELRVSYQSIPMELLETKILQLVEERLGSVTTSPKQPSRCRNKWNMSARILLICLAIWSYLSFE